MTTQPPTVHKTCTYDSGSMYGCRPVCSAPAVSLVSWREPCYGETSAAVCKYHEGPMVGRAFPWIATVTPLASAVAA